MESRKLGEMEQKFAALIWESAPITSRELTERAAEAFGWKRTTTYTMLRRLCDYGLFANEGGTVTVCMTRDEFEAAQGERFVDETFRGSLPRFVAAFARRRPLSQQEIDELRRLIDTFDEKEG
jgi:predicted transcriptional regulator